MDTMLFTPPSRKTGIAPLASQEGSKHFFFLKEKEAKRTFVRLGSETPIPGGAHPPTFRYTDRV